MLTAGRTCSATRKVLNLVGMGVALFCSFLFLAEAVFMIFTQEHVKRLVLKLRDHFPGAVLVFDVSSPLGCWLGNRAYLLIFTSPRQPITASWLCMGCKRRFRRLSPRHLPINLGC